VPAMGDTASIRRLPDHTRLPSLQHFSMAVVLVTLPVNTKPELPFCADWFSY